MLDLRSACLWTRSDHSPLKETSERFYLRARHRREIIKRRDQGNMSRNRRRIRPHATQWTLWPPHSSFLVGGWRREVDRQRKRVLLEQGRCWDFPERFWKGGGLPHSGSRSSRAGVVAPGHRREGPGRPRGKAAHRGMSERTAMGPRRSSRWRSHGAPSHRLRVLWPWNSKFVRIRGLVNRVARIPLPVVLPIGSRFLDGSRFGFVKILLVE